MFRYFPLFFWIGCLTLYLSCSSAPNIDHDLIGSWRMKRANIHSIHSYRQNGSWVEQERVEGKFSRIVENKEKVEGSWDVEYNKEEQKLILVITPSTVGKEDKRWTKDTPTRFEVLEINNNVLILKTEAGQVVNWSRVRSSQAGDDEAALGIAMINPGALVVNLQLERKQDKFRFLCLDLQFSVEEVETIEYVAVERDPETQVPSYHLHPVVMDKTITFFSSQTYKDIKSLDKVKNVVNDLRLILNPYFKGRLTEIKVNKVVVTANPESVDEFEKVYAQEHGLVAEVREGDVPETASEQ